MSEVVEWVMGHWDLNREDAQWVADNPCIGDHNKDERCLAYPKCAGCTSLNGLFFLKLPQGGRVCDSTGSVKTE